MVVGQVLGRARTSPPSTWRPKAEILRRELPGRGAWRWMR
jgi:hypothetical protein